MLFLSTIVAVIVSTMLHLQHNTHVSQSIGDILVKGTHCYKIIVDRSVYPIVA